MDTTQLQALMNTPVDLSPEVMASIMLGIGLSASCGFRVFLPPLILSIAALYFSVPVPQGLAWIGTEPAFYTLLSAAIVEVAAYYIPWLDNLLDHLTAPLSVVAGTLLTGSFLNGHMSPLMQWTIALIAGGGAAGAVQGLTTTSRLATLAATAGLANPVVATAENALAIGVPVLAIAFPVITAIVGLVIFIVVINFTWGLFRKKPARAATPSVGTVVDVTSEAVPSSDIAGPKSS